MPKKSSAPDYVLEPIDIYGNWKVRRLTFCPPKMPVGLTRESTFKIKNKGSKHVLVKKKNVDWKHDNKRWKGSRSEIPLTKIPPKEKEPLKANLRLKARVSFQGASYVVFLGSDNNGKGLKFVVLPKELRTQPGALGTAGRGGG